MSDAGARLSSGSEEPSTGTATEDVRRRMLYTLPLIILFIAIKFASVVAVAFERYFLYYDIGALPLLTQGILDAGVFLVKYPGTHLTGMLACSWLFLTYGCTTKTRMRVLAFSFSIAALLISLISIYALYIPIMPCSCPMCR